jgi:magnesium transporter
LKESGHIDLNRPVREYASAVDTAFHSDLTIAEVLCELRKRNVNHKIIYFYVIDRQHRLVGVVSTRKLLLSDPASRLNDVMDSPVISVTTSATMAEAMAQLHQHRLLALPVVDDQRDGRLVGIIDVELYSDETLNPLHARRTHDLFQFIGLSLQQLQQGKAGHNFLMRVPWLMCNVISGLVCAAIAAYYREVLGQVLVLAMFIPLVLTVSESIAMQSMSLTTQYLYSRRIHWPRISRHAWLEGRTAVLLGLTCGAVVALAASFWTPAPATLGVISLSVAATMVLAAVTGVVTPVGLHALRLDPKVAAGPVVLMIADVVTAATYLGMATMLLL